MKYMRFFLILLCFLVSACAGTYTHTIDFNPSEPLRIAVLPFLTVDSDGKPKEEEGRLVLDNLALVSSALEATPSQIVRKFTINQLSKTGLDIVSSALIDIDLPHRGYGTADGKLDTIKVNGESAKALCTTFLDCDAVLYGKVTRWDRSYYGIQSVNTVGIELKLVSARTGKTIFEGKGEDSESRGITKIPTGLSSVVLEPIKGLDSEIIVSLANSVVRQVLEPLDVSKRAEFLETAPPAIFASSHDAKGKVSSHTPLIVVMFASPGSTGSFSIGTSVTDLPMIERAPGHYYGEYVSLPGDSFKNEPVVVSVTDSFGRTTKQEISKDSISLQ